MKHVAQRDQANAPPKRLPLRLIVPAGGALVAVLLVAALVAPSLLGGQGGAGGPAPDAPGAAPASSTSTTTTLGVTCGTWSQNWRDHCESLQLAAPATPPTTSSYGATTTTVGTTPQPGDPGPTDPTVVTSPAFPLTPGSPSPSSEWTSVVAKASPAVMRVDAVGAGSGTGFQVDRKGHVVTNRHVVDGATKFRVRTTGGRTLTAKLVGKSARHDIAVLRVKGLKAKPLAWSGGKPKMGQGVLTLGFPQGAHANLLLAASQGIVSGTGRDLSDPMHRDMVQYDMPTNAGNSGGPVLGHDGRVVAVHASKAVTKQNMNYGVLGANARDVVKRLVD
jgi:S1-C subfamily serine protease